MHKNVGISISCALLLLLSFNIQQIQSVSAPIENQPVGVFWLNYSDPASDVSWVYPNGTKELHDNPADVNIKWLRSEDNNTKIKLIIELKKPGLVNTSIDAYYQVNIYTNKSRNESHFVARYSGTECTLTKNTSTTTINNTVEYIVSNSGNAGILYINVSKDDIKDNSGKIEYFNIDAIASKKDGNMTYTDYGWEIPGNPGSIPTPTPSDGGIPGNTLLIIGLIVLILLVLILIILFIVYKKRKKGTEETQPPNHQ